MAVHFDSFGTEYVPQEVLNKIGGKSITYNIFRIQDDDFIICKFSCISYLEHTIAGNTLFDYTNFFSPNNYKKNDKTIYKYFKNKYGKRRT